MIRTIQRLSLKRLLTDALFWVLLGLLLATGWLNLHTLSLYSRFSLRYDTEIDGKTAYAARQYSIERRDEGSFWPTFWREETVSFSSQTAQTDATRILYSGDAFLVWPTVYVNGTAPGAADGAGCAVSAALAWALWGGVDVVGIEVEINGETRVVRGVFEGEEALALVSVRDEDRSYSFNAVELSGGDMDAVSADVEGYAVSAGLGRPNAVLIGGVPFFLAWLMAALPLIVPVLYGLARCIDIIKNRSAAALRACVFVFVAAFAILLPHLLNALPAFLIPTRWSDFSFWAALSGQIGDILQEFLSVTPTLRDVAWKTLLLKQTGIAFVAFLCALLICFRWHNRMQPIIESYVEEHPDAYMKEIGESFGCSATAVQKALRRLGIARKKRQNDTVSKSRSK